MMTNETLQKNFEKAVALVNNYNKPLPADFLLKIYALYKKATNDEDKPSSKREIINAFKTNALFQIKHISSEDAKKVYIKTVDDYFNKL